MTDRRRAPRSAVRRGAEASTIFALTSMGPLAGTLAVVGPLRASAAARIATNSSQATAAVAAADAAAASAASARRPAPLRRPAGPHGRARVGSHQHGGYDTLAQRI